MVQILPTIKQHKCRVGLCGSGLPGGPLACAAAFELGQAPPNGLIGTDAASARLSCLLSLAIN